jgi:glycine/D-amino acid oxidase-like deaminating enzyme
MDFDYIVIGGGLVGSAIAYGLSRQSENVAILDGGDRSFRASRGNFGLVWVQGKGWNYAPYAQWCLQAADLWVDFNSQLEKETGISTGYTRSGGIHICIDEEEWNTRVKILSEAAKHTDGRFKFEMLDTAALKQQIPQVSDEVVGASYSEQDGHVDPLGLLHALHNGLQNRKVNYYGNQSVTEIEPIDTGFRISTMDRVFSAKKIVLCAGLGNEKLGSMVGMDIPVVVDRGQVMITERLEKFLDLPTLHVRQTVHGTVQIGDSHEDVGLNDGTDPFVLKKIAQRAVLMFPFLSSVRLIRAWGALRIMTPDNNPIYQQSIEFPGAYTATCHSGVTLAAAHAGPVAEWIMGKNEKSLLDQFGTERFNV